MSNKLIVIDFNRTLFDPESRQLLTGALKLLEATRANGFVCVLLAQAAPSRRQLIDSLGLTTYFAEIILTERKTSAMLVAIAAKYQAEPKDSYIVGDRAKGEITLGTATGWHTIWLQAGRFAHELPAANPTHTVHQLNEVTRIMSQP